MPTVSERAASRTMAGKPEVAALERLGGNGLARIAALVTLLTVSPSCRPPIRTVTVAGTDNAFQAPDTVSGGRTAISFQNRGRVPHELVMGLLKPGVRLEMVLETAHRW
ncbi:MAG: hypothetical protein ACREOF_03485 [Gemmatimonadales bacterium]